MMWSGQGRREREFVNHFGFSRLVGETSLAIRQWFVPGRLSRHLLALAVTTLLFVWLAPFGTGQRFDLLARTFYAATAITFNWLLGVALVQTAGSMAASAGKPVWLGIVAGALAASVPGAGVVFLLEAWLDEAPALAADLLYIYASVALVHVTLGLVMRRLLSTVPTSPPDTSSRANQASSAPPFMARLPSRLGHDLLHLKMQDHYVEVHTTEGSALVLLRFRDALREVSALPGMQVHRSHWVAKHAVAKVRRREGRILLALTNGNEVPVSRSFAPTLKQHGWV